MERTRIGIAFTVLAALFLSAAASAGTDTVDTWRYVAGSGIQDTYLVCTSLSDASNEPRPEVGGVCGVPIRAETIVITVTDDLLGPVGFTYTGEFCSFSGHATSPATLSPPPGCVNLYLAPDVGTATGIIEVRAPA